MASHGLNTVVIIGSRCVDPEIRSASNGKTIANLSLATSGTWKDQRGKQLGRTDWHRVMVSSRTAEVAQTCQRHGSKLFIGGPLQARKQ